MQGLGAKVRETLVTALSKALIVAEKVVQSRWPKKSNGATQTTGYAGQASHITRWSVPTGAKAETHTLHATTGDNSPTGTTGQAANNNHNNAPATGTVIYRGTKEVPLEKQLHEWNEQTKDKNSDFKKNIVAAVSHLKEKLNPLVNAIAKAFKNFNTKLEAVKKIRDKKDSKPQQIAAAESESAAAFTSLAKAQEAAEPALQQQAKLVEACEADAAGCFAAGTKLWTPLGYQNVEDLLEGDLVFSRNEYDPSGLIEANPIEKAFRRLAEVQHLHLRGPNGYLVTIRTTGEHPFYAFNRGWIPTKELTSIDWVLTESGEWAKVEDIFATGEMEIVYNLRVADWHTYFVGGQGWGWSVWAHNAYTFISGLKIVELVKKKYASLSDTDSNTIIKKIRNEGTYGGVGEEKDVVDRLVAAAKNGNSFATTLTQYFKLKCVVVKRNSLEKEIRHRSDEDDTSSGTTIYGWTAYIHDSLGDKDARGKTYDKYRQEIITSGGDPDSPKTHGHHIVFKQAAAGGAGEVYAQEAKDILLYYGLDPYFGRENLAYAPNQGHKAETLEYIRDELLKEMNKSVSAQRIKNVLKTIAKDYIDRQMPGML